MVTIVLFILTSTKNVYAYNYSFTSDFNYIFSEDETESVYNNKIVTISPIIKLYFNGDIAIYAIKIITDINEEIIYLPEEIIFLQ